MGDNRGDILERVGVPEPVLLSALLTMTADDDRAVEAMIPWMAS